MEPNPRTPAFYQDYLAKRWAEGCQHGQMLMEEIQERGNTGCFFIWPDFWHHGGKL
jgi:hypothetical protein